MHDWKKTTVWRRLSSALLALSMTLSLLPALERPVRADFSDSSMDKLVNWGVVGGYPDGSLRPERNLTRAEFVAMVNRAYGYNTPAETPFYDVTEDAWYYDDIGSAYKVGYFTGVSPHMAEPDEELTREQAVVLISRNMRLDPVPGEVTEFEDGRDCADWSRGYVRAAKQAGIIGGYPNGTYKPQGDITCGEMAVMLQRALGTLVNEPGEHVLSDVYGNVTISNTNAKLKDTTIAGDLYITGGLDLGDITLENVRVLGDIIVAGGGESHQGESIILRNVEADSLLVDSIADQYVSLAVEGNTEIADAKLRSDAYIQDRTRPGQGLLNISLESPDVPAEFTLSGNLESVINKTAGSALNIAMGTVDNLTVDEFARDANLNLDINSTAKNLNLDVATTVTGVGDIDQLNVNANGTTVDILPDSIAIRPGVVSNINGEEMNAAEAIESSSDPRLLAGYPKVRNIAPTSATSAYEANKAGTVYWAVSTTTDGSIGEDELVSPTTDNNRVALNGELKIEDANKEVTAALDKLATDTNYYLSAVMVDARNRHSPVKVVSFVTPDNTKPAFTTGYPAVLRNYCESVKITGTENGATVTLTDRNSDQNPKRNYRVQVAAMPNKNCQLYYALYEKGSTAPTAQQFRTGALGKPIRSGAEDATKNRINYIELTNLEELREYDIYLCLIDADGALSSDVKKLTFKTVDGKPPRFQYESPTVAEEAINSLRLTVNVSEDATVYWVASKSDKYIKDNVDANGKSEWTDDEWWERACRQIEGGGGGNVVRSGNVKAKANTDTALTITGLEAATGYYVYFVAKDAAGNYSEFFRANHDYDVKNSLGVDRPEVDVTHNQQPYKYYLQANTLDNIPPTVTQEFTHLDATDNTRPHAATAVTLTFSEEVMQYSANRNNLQSTLTTFKTLYEKVKTAQAASDASPADADLKKAASDARDELATALRSTVKLYNANSVGNESVIDRSDPYATNKDKWVIDYRYVEVDVDDETGELTLTFPGEYSLKSDKSDQWAINLASGSTYYFVLDDIADISTSRNRMGRTQLENFTTVSAQVQLRNVNVTSINVSGVAKPVPIDMAFSMTPVTTNVEDDVDWDILFWSDSSVTFEIYELDPNSGTGRPVKAVIDGEENAAASPTAVSIVNHNSKINTDTKLDDYEGYEGRSLFHDFYKLSFFPGVTGKNEKHLISNKDTEAGRTLKKSGIMTNDEPKYYGVHFTAIGSEPEATGRTNGIWDATINFRVSVLTGPSSGLLTLSRQITKAKLQEAENDLGVAQIHSPRPFFMRAQFANSDAPNFASNWPSFENTDTSMTINVELTRPGTLYWVVAPASTKIRQSDNTMKVSYVPTIDTYAYFGENSSIKLAYDDATGEVRYYAKQGEGTNNKRYVPFNGSDTTPPAGTTIPLPFQLSSPANDQIYDPNFTSDRIKSGKLDLARGIGTINVTDLEPDTIYLVYFVMQGTGQVYSPRAQVFQTRTETIRRPNLKVTNNDSSASIASSNMKAVADCGLFLLDKLTTMPLFSASIKDVLDPEQQADFDTHYYDKNDPAHPTHPEGRVDKDGKLYRDYTVLEAMAQRDLDGRNGTLFDLYASEDQKNQIAAMIRAEGSSNRVDGKRNLELPGGDSKYVEFRSDKMTQDQDYALLVVARAAAGDEGASGHSLGFAAAYPLYDSTESTPRVMSIDGKVTVDYKTLNNGSHLMGGYILVSFDRALNLYDRSQNPPKRTPLTKTTVGDKTDKGFLSSSTNNLDFITVTSPSASDAVQTVKIDFPINAVYKVFSGNTITFYANSLLAGPGAQAQQGKQLGIKLEYKNGEVVGSLINEEYWAGESMTINITTEILAREATDIANIRPSALSIEVEQSATLTATLTPSGSTGEINWWVVSGGSNVDTAVSGDTLTVTGKAVGQAVIRAELASDPTKYKECTVTVTKPKANSLVINPTSITVDKTPIRVSITVKGPSGCDLTLKPTPQTTFGNLVTVSLQQGTNGEHIAIISPVAGNPGGVELITFTTNDGAKAAVLDVTVKAQS